MRAALAARGVLSYRLLYFERDGDGRFKPPPSIRATRWSPSSTHDLPTLAGWWQGRDLAVRAATRPAAASPSMARGASRARARARDAAALLPRPALRRRRRSEPRRRAAGRRRSSSSRATPSAVLVLQLEDVLGVIEQANLPGTTDEHPNWRRKLPLRPSDAWPRRALQRLAAQLARRCARSRALRRATRRRAAADALIPRATYRLQLHGGFTFDDAARIAALPRARWASATSTARRSCARGRAASTATTSSATTRSIPRSAAARALRALRAALQRTAWAS